MTNALKAESIPPTIEKALQELTQQLQQICQDNLVALILYGGLVRGSYQENRSDVNLMVVLKKADAATLQAIGAPLTAARRKSNVEPFILEEQEVACVADVFPIKILDIQRSHRVLAGRDVFGSITVDREHIRLSVEQSLRNMQLRLRRTLATHHQDRLTLERFLREMVRPLALELRQLMELKGSSSPRGDGGANPPAHQGGPGEGGLEATREIFQAVAQPLGLDPKTLDQLSQWRDGRLKSLDAAALAAQVLDLLGVAAHLADALESEA